MSTMEIVSNPTTSDNNRRFELTIPTDDDTKVCGKIPFESRKKAYLQLKKYAETGTFSCWYDEVVKPASSSSSCSCSEDESLDNHSIGHLGRDWERQTFVSIEGSIGVGKTHLSEAIHRCLVKKYPFEITYLIEEKVNLDWLNAFIDDPPKRAAIFQVKRLMETINGVKEMWAKLLVHREYGHISHCIGDRLPLGNFAFALVHHSAGNIDDAIFNLYGITLADGGPYNYPDVALLLCKPEVALERIKARDRRGESSYTIEYLEKLDEATLFGLLYIWYTGVVRVVPFQWDEFGTPDNVLDRMNTLSWDDIGTDSSHPYSSKVRSLRSEVYTSLLSMSYGRMREIVYQLADIVKGFDK